MIKVGIMSMQRIKNYGSFLQAYGLKRVLEEMGCDVQFVDYHPGKPLVNVRAKTGIARIVDKLFEVFSYSAPFKEKIRFIKYKKNYASKYYPLLGITDEYNYSPDLDVLIIGSDEVFNCIQSNTNVGFSPELFGYGHNSKKLISYAASFGNTTLDKIKEYGISTKLTDWLSEFDSISVRDANSGQIVCGLLGETPEYHLDPVLVYDFVKECSDIPESVSEKSKYMILYGYSGRFSIEECRHIKQFAARNSLKVLCIGGVQSVCDRFVDVNPFEVIAYFKGASCVITDTFHGTILSVITHKPFVAAVRTEGYGNSQKLSDLLERLQLTDRAISDIRDVETKMSQKIDYEKVDNILEVEREKARIYLESVIEK